MAYTENINQLQKDSFENVGGSPARRVSVVASTTIPISGTISSTGSLLSGKTFDYIAATYPTTSQEVYTYKSGGSGGTTVATITVNYSDAVTKLIISSVVLT